MPPMIRCPPSPWRRFRALAAVLLLLACGCAPRFGGYTPVLWGLAGIMLIAALGFAAAAALSKRSA